MSRFIFSLTFILALGLAPLAQSFAKDAPAVQALLNSRSRPTMQQLMDAGGLHETGYVDVSNITSRVPFLIASLEKAFPGARFAPLGRDAATFGDILDAFYLSIGQSGRVSRLNASGASFNNATQNTIVEFLVSAGMPREFNASTKPFVMIDATNYSQNSQSTRLMTAAYSVFNSKYPMTQTTRLVNFVNLKESMYKGNIVGQGFNFENYFQRVGQSRGIPSDILTIPAGSLTYGTEWHSNFGPLQNVGGGRIEGPPGQMSADQNRRDVLNYQISILKAVSTPQFLAAVKAEARSLGYEFMADPKIAAEQRRQQEAKEKAAQAEIKRLAEVGQKEYWGLYVQRLNAEVAGLSAPTEQPGEKYMSVNAESMLALMDQELANLRQIHAQNPNFKVGADAVVFQFIVAMVDAQKRGVILDRDFRRMLARAFSAVVAPTEGFIRNFTEFFLKEPFLQKEFVSRKEFFMTTFQTKARAGMENTAAVYTAIFNALNGNGDSRCAKLLLGAA